MTDSDMLTLREATVEGLFCSLDAARKAVQRSGLKPAGRDGSAHLYFISDLATLGSRMELAAEDDSSGHVEGQEETGEWVSWRGFSMYEASHRGRVRSVDGRVVGGRTLRGVVLKSRLDDEGYAWVNVTGDDGRRYRIPVHRAVLLAHAGTPQPGQETLHGPGGRSDNRYPENLRWGTKKENHDDMVTAGTAVVPESFGCVTASCDGRTKHPGRRCLDCVKLVGQLAAQLLAAGMPSMEVAERFGYTGDRWVFDLAVQHGAYAGDRAAARVQRPSLVQRVQILGILRLARRSGQLRGDAS